MGFDSRGASDNMLLKQILRPDLETVTVTIAAGQSESAEVDLAGAALVSVVAPATLEATTAQVALKHGLVSGTRYPRQKDGVRQVIPVDTTNREAVVDVGDYPALRFVSLVAETAAGAPVVQTAKREFVLVVRPV